MTNLKVGDKVPVSLLKKANLNFSDLKGKKIILYFYPKDDTPTCSTEACNLRDNYKVLKSKGYEVIGVSPDSEKSHQKFISKFKLPYKLIPDTEKEILHDFGVWGEKMMFGRKYMGVIRTTFVISEKGIIEKIINKVDSKEHTSQILKEMEG